MYEQGAGLFDLKEAFNKINDPLVPKASLFPSKLNLSDEDVYAYPYSLQPLYHTAIPTVLNLTVHNSKELYSVVKKIEWVSSSTLKSFVDVFYICVIIKANL